MMTSTRSNDEAAEMMTSTRSNDEAAEMMTSTRSNDEAACLRVAVDLLERSDACAAAEPVLSRQYARQAYQLGCRSPRLPQSIAKARIRMIVQKSGRSARRRPCRVTQILDSVRLNDSGFSGRTIKAGLVILTVLASTLLASTPLREPSPDQRITAAVGLADATL